MNQVYDDVTGKTMPQREYCARIIARALGHNDETGMYWERYILAADALIRRGVV